MLELDDETRETLGFGGGADDVDYARYVSVLLANRNAAKARYRSTPQGQNKYDLHESQYTTREQRANRKRSHTMRKSGRPILKGYARIKAWREQNPEKWKAIQARYEKSAKGKAVKSKKNRKYYERRKAA